MRNRYITILADLVFSQDHNRATYDFLGLNTLPAHVEETDSAGGGDAPIAIVSTSDSYIYRIICCRIK